MRRVYLLKESYGNYLSISKERDEAFRFENPEMIQKLVSLLNLEVEEIQDEESVKDNADFTNNW